MILQNDFKRQWNRVQESVVTAMRRVGASGWYILGEEVTAFENALAALWRLKHAVGVGNGMDALEIGLRCLGLQPGDKVLTTPLSAFATTLAIIRAGGVPVFIDVDDLGLVDLEQCRDIFQTNQSIRFFVPVHLYGFPLDLQELGRLKKDFGLRIVEDCAQAIGACDHRIRAGSVGQVAATSFYPTKNLGALGDGGALLTNDPELARKAASLRNYGQTELYVHSEIGLNSRLDELHAAILRDAFLPNLQGWMEARSRTAQAYLSGIKHSLIELPVPPAEATSVWHLFPVRVAQGRRDDLREYLRAKDILTGVHYPLIIPEQPAFVRFGRGEIAIDPAKARLLASCELSLPIHPFLKEEEIEAVITTCNRWAP